MAITRSKKRSKKTRGKLINLDKPGYYYLPVLVRIEGFEKGRWLNILVMRVFTGWGQRLHLPITSQAVASLVIAPAKEIPFETLTRRKEIQVQGMAEPSEMPVLEQFVCYRAIKDTVRILDFSHRSDRHILVPFVSVAYQQLLAILKTPIHVP